MNQVAEHIKVIVGDEKQCQHYVSDDYASQSEEEHRQGQARTLCKGEKIDSGAVSVPHKHARINQKQTQQKQKNEINHVRLIVVQEVLFPKIRPGGVLHSAQGFCYQSFECNSRKPECHYHDGVQYRENKG